MRRGAEHPTDTLRTEPLTIARASQPGQTGTPRPMSLFRSLINRLRRRTICSPNGVAGGRSHGTVPQSTTEDLLRERYSSPITLETLEQREACFDDSPQARVDFLAHGQDGTLLALYARPALFNTSGPDGVHWHLYRGDGSQIHRRDTGTQVKGSAALQPIPSLDYCTTTDRSTPPTSYDTSAGEFRSETDDAGNLVFWLNTTRFTLLNRSPLAVKIQDNRIILLPDANRLAADS